MSTEILNVKRSAGVAGQFSVTVTVRFADDSETTTTEFVGSAYGSPGPVVMILSSGAQTFVTDPARFGSKFGTEWVRRFVEGMDG